jgi:hypothetical protein
MKGMALETVAEIIIALVATLIVISIISFYKDQISNFFNNIIHPQNGPEAEIVNSTSFTTSQIKTFIMACWDKYQKKANQEIVCYALLGDVSGVNSSDLASSISLPGTVDIRKFDSSKKTTVIKTVRGGIAVESI